MKRLGFLIFSIVVALAATPALAGQTDDLLSTIEALKIQRNGYVLGRKMTPEQLSTAAKSTANPDYPGTLKFSDKDLFIVTNQSTGRVLIMFERLAPLNLKKARDMFGSLVFEFGEPTVAAHDKAVFWVFTKDGKISEKRFMQAKNANKPLDILATVKLSSSRKIGELIDIESKLTDEDLKEDSLYYVISPSEKILTQIQSAED